MKKIKKSWAPVNGGYMDELTAIKSFLEEYHKDVAMECREFCREIEITDKVRNAIVGTVPPNKMSEKQIRERKSYKTFEHILRKLKNHRCNKAEILKMILNGINYRGGFHHVRTAGYAWESLMLLIKDNHL